MRRKEKEVTDNKIIESVLNEAMICRIGMSYNNMPYIVPMNFVYYNNCIYIHSAAEGKKIDILRENNHVCVEATVKEKIVEAEKACNWGMQFISVVATGRAYFIDDLSTKKKVLQLLMKKHSGKSDWELPDKAVEKTSVIKIDIENITCKKSGL